MIVSQPRIAKYLKELHKHTASYARAAQKLLVPMIATSREVSSNNDNYKHISIEHTDSYRYNGNWYYYKDSEDKYWETFGILKIDDIFMTYQINSVTNKCFVGSIERLVYNNIIYPFLLFIDNKVVPWDNIELVYDSGDTWIILRGPQFTNYNLTKAQIFDIILFPFRCEFFGEEDDYSFKYKYAALNDYLNNTSYIDDNGDFHIRSITFNTEVVYGNATTNIGAWVYKQIKYKELGLLSDERIEQLSHIDVSRTIYDTKGYIYDIQTYKFNIFDIDVPTDAIDNNYLYSLDNIDDLPTIWFNDQYLCDSTSKKYRFTIIDDDTHIEFVNFNDSYLWNLSDIDAMLFRENFLVFRDGKFEPEFKILTSINNITLLPNDDKLQGLAILIYNDESLHVLRNSDNFKKDFMSEQAILYFEALQNLANDSGKGLPNSSKTQSYIDAITEGDEFTESRTINHITSETLKNFTNDFEPKLDSPVMLLNPSDNSTISDLSNTTLLDAHLIPSGTIIRGIKAYTLDIELAFVPSITDYIVYLSRYTDEQELAIELMSKLIDPLDFLLSLDISYDENINNTINSIISYDVNLLNPLYSVGVTSKCFTGKEVNESFVFDFMYEHRRGIKVSRDRFKNRETYFMMFVNGELYDGFSETRCYANFFFIPIDDDKVFNDNDNIEFIFYHGVNNNEIRFFLSDWLIDQTKVYDKDPTFYTISVFDQFINPKDLKIFSHYPKNILQYPTLIPQESENIAFNISFRDENNNLVIKKDALSHIIGENIRSLVESSGQTIPDEISNALDNVDIDTYKNILKDNTFISSIGTDIYNTNLMVTRNALVATSSKKFVYQRLYVDRKSYRIKLDKRFRYCDNPKHYLLFINGRRMRQDSFLITIPKHTRPFWDMYLYTAVFVDENDRIELFYLPYDMTDINFAENQRHYIETNGYFEFDRSSIDVPLSNRLYLFFINGKKIPSNKIINVDSNTIRIAIDTATTRYPMVTAINLNTIPQVEDYLHSDSLSKMDSLIEYLKSHSQGLDLLDKMLGCNVKMSEIEDDKIWMNVAKIAILNEIIRDFWVTSGYDYHRQPFLYDYDKDEIFEKDSEGNLILPSLDATPIINIKRNDISLLYFYTEPENLVIEFGNNVDILKFFWEYSQRFNQDLHILSQTMNGIELGGDARYYETPFDPNTTIYKFIANTGQQFIIKTTEVSYANGIYWGRISESELEYYRRLNLYQDLSDIVAVLPKDGIIPDSLEQELESGNASYYTQIIDKNDIVYELDYGDDYEKPILPWIDPSLQNIYEEDFLAIDTSGKRYYNPEPSRIIPDKAEDILLSYIDGTINDIDPFKYDNIVYELNEYITYQSEINYRDFNILDDGFMAIANRINDLQPIIVSTINDAYGNIIMTDTSGTPLTGIDLDTGEEYIISQYTYIDDIDPVVYTNLILAMEPKELDNGETYNIESYNSIIAIDEDYRVYRNMYYDNITSLFTKPLPEQPLLLNLDDSGLTAEINIEGPNGAQPIFNNSQGYDLLVTEQDGLSIMHYDDFNMIDLDTGEALGSLQIYPEYKVYDDWYREHGLEIKDIYGNVLLTTKDVPLDMLAQPHKSWNNLTIVTEYTKVSRFGDDDVLNIEAYLAEIESQSSEKKFVFDTQYKELSELKVVPSIRYDDIIYDNYDFMAIISNMQYANSIIVSVLNDRTKEIEFTNYVDSPLQAVDLDTGEVYDTLQHFYLDDLDIKDLNTGDSITYVAHLYGDIDPYEADEYTNEMARKANEIIYKNLIADTKFYITLPNDEIQALSGTLVTYTVSRIVRDITYTLDIENTSYYTDYINDEDGLIRVRVDDTIYGQSLELEDYSRVYPSVLSEFGIILDYDPYLDLYDAVRIPITPAIQGISLEPEDYGRVYFNILEENPVILSDGTEDEDEFIEDYNAPITISDDKNVFYNDFILESLKSLVGEEVDNTTIIDLEGLNTIQIHELYGTHEDYKEVNGLTYIRTSNTYQGVSLEPEDYGTIYYNIFDETTGDIYDLFAEPIETVLSLFNEPIVVTFENFKAFILTNSDNYILDNEYSEVINSFDALQINTDYNNNIYDPTDDNFFGIPYDGGQRITNITYDPYYEEYRIEQDTTVYTTSNLYAQTDISLEPIDVLYTNDSKYNTFDPTDLEFEAILHDGSGTTKGLTYIVDEQRISYGREETLTDIYRLYDGIFAEIDQRFNLVSMHDIQGIDLDTGEKIDLSNLYGLSDNDELIPGIMYNDLDNLSIGSRVGPILYDLYTVENNSVYAPDIAIFHNGSGTYHDIEYIFYKKEPEEKTYNFFNFEDGEYMAITENSTISDINYITMYNFEPIHDIDIIDIDKFEPLKFIYTEGNDDIIRSEDNLLFVPNEHTEIRNIHHYNINSGSFRIIETDTNIIRSFEDLSFTANEYSRHQNIGFVDIDEYKKFMIAIVNGTARVIKGLDYTIDGQADNTEVIIIEYDDTLFAVNMHGELIRNFQYENHEYSWSNQHLINIVDDDFLVFLNDGNILRNLQFYYDQNTPERRHYYNESNLPSLIRRLDKHLFKEPQWIKYNKYNIGNENYFVFACPKRLIYNGWHTVVRFGLPDISSDEFFKNHSQGLTSIPLYTSGLFNDDGTLVTLDNMEMTYMGECKYTNDYGYTETYMVWRTNGFFKQLASYATINMEVKIGAAREPIVFIGDIQQGTDHTIDDEIITLNYQEASEEMARQILNTIKVSADSMNTESTNSQQPKKPTIFTDSKGQKVAMMGTASNKEEKLLKEKGIFLI